MDINNGVLFIDTSYYIFYKYFSTLSWVKRKDDKVDVANILNHALFMNHFKRGFESGVVDLSTRHKVPLENVIFVKDCPRDHIWRMKFFPQYKASREEKKEGFNKDIFKYVYSIMIPWMKDRYMCKEVEAECLEADDIIAISVDQLRTLHPLCRTVVISNDNDFVQLYGKNVELYNMQHKNVYERIQSPSRYLDMKIIMGDKSDNIPPIMRKCGDKTAEKILQDEEFKKKILQKKEVERQLHMNKMLIDFAFIPETLKKNFQRIFQELIYT